MPLPCPQVITFRDFDFDDARRWFPISFLLVLVIYTGSKSLVSLGLSLWRASLECQRADLSIERPQNDLLLMIHPTPPPSYQQYLSIPVYTIFKNLTIILIAYGEVLWFGGHVTGMTLVSFGLMVSRLGQRGCRYGRRWSNTRAQTETASIRADGLGPTVPPPSSLFRPSIPSFSFPALLSRSSPR